MSDLVLAGGAESLSHSPLVFSRSAVEWYARLNGARDPWSKFMALLKVRPSFFKPVIGLERGLTDPIVELNMGQTAELVAHLFHITRQQADAYAAESQKRLARAQAEGWLKDEIEPAFARDGTLYDHDDGVRPDSSVESLAKLKPAFERPWGKVTPGNSSQITDGASWVILASEDAVKRAQAAAQGGHRRQRMVGARSLHHGSWPGAVLDGAPEAAPTGARRYRVVGIERSLRGAGARLPRGLGRP